MSKNKYNWTQAEALKKLGFDMKSISHNCNIPYETVKKHFQRGTKTVPPNEKNIENTSVSSNLKEGTNECQVILMTFGKLGIKMELDSNPSESSSQSVRKFRAKKLFWEK